MKGSYLTTKFAKFNSPKESRSSHMPNKFKIISKTPGSNPQTHLVFIRSIFEYTKSNDKKKVGTFSPKPRN